jgi:hypothetical protein
MDQQRQQKPDQTMPNKQNNPSRGQTDQQTQQGNRPGQGGYSSPGQHSDKQSAPADKK